MNGLLLQVAFVVSVWSVAELLEYCTYVHASTIDSLHVALLATTYYYYTVTNYGNYSALVQVTWYVMRFIHARIVTSVGVGASWYVLRARGYSLCLT